jgi:hypothetical protein
MFRRPTKKQLLIRRIFFSAVATLAVLIILTVTILFMLGFRLDSGNGRLEQGALLQFDSTPNTADVSIDGKATGVRTAGKQTVSAGIHSVLYTKPGYENWSRTLDFAAGTLTWLDYARMVPKDRTPEKVASYATIVGAKASPDMKFMLLQEDAAVPQFQLADLRSADVKLSMLDIPATVYSEAGTVGVAHSFAMDKWNVGGRYILIKHTYNDRSEWLMVDTENVSQTINITRLLSVNFTDLKFAGTNGRTLFGLVDDRNIRKLDLSSATLSRALVSNVSSFDLFDTNTISYVGIDPNDPTKQVAGVYRDGDDQPHVLRAVDSLDTVLKIAVGEYFNDNYVAIAEGSEVTILKGNYQVAGNDDMTNMKPFASMSLMSSVTQLSFSPKSDYIVAANGDSFKTYEIEHSRSAGGAIDSNPAAASTQLQWLDTAHLWNRQSDTLVMRDFDNSNVYTINAITGDFDVTVSQNGRFIYSIGTADQGFSLQRVKMILE